MIGIELCSIYSYFTVQSRMVAINIISIMILRYSTFYNFMDKYKVGNCRDLRLAKSKPRDSNAMMAKLRTGKNV